MQQSCVGWFGASDAGGASEVRASDAEGAKECRERHGKGGSLIWLFVVRNEVQVSGL